MGGSKFHGLLTFFPSLSSLNTKGPLSVLVFFFPLPLSFLYFIFFYETYYDCGFCLGIEFNILEKVH